jgi:hypothetical protein
MDDKLRRETEMSQRVYLFLDENKTDFTSIAAVMSAIEILRTELQVIADLGAKKISATADAKDFTINKGNLRIALRKAMQDITDMWEPMAKNYENAQNKFKMPRGSDQLLIDTAGSYIEDAQALKTAFTNRRMPEDFIEDLIAKRDAFVAIIGEASTARIERVGVNAQIPNSVERCVTAVRDIDPIVKMVYRDKPGKLAEWISASHVERHS